MIAHVFLITSTRRFLGPVVCDLEFNGLSLFHNTKTITFEEEIDRQMLIEEVLIVTPNKPYIIDLTHKPWVGKGDTVRFAPGNLYFSV